MIAALATLFAAALLIVPGAMVLAVDQSIVRALGK